MQACPPTVPPIGSLSFRGFRSEGIRGSDEMNINFRSGLRRSSRARGRPVDAISFERKSAVVQVRDQAVQDGIHMRPLLTPIKPREI